MAKEKAYVVRPFPHGIHRLKEFLTSNRVAVGWPLMGSLESCKDRNAIKKILRENYGYSSRKLGNAGGQLHRFCNELSINDFVLVPNGSQVYIGRVTSTYKYDPEKDSEVEGWCHYRDVEWLFEKQPVEKTVLDGKIVASLKGQSTFFESWGDSVAEFVKKNPKYRPDKLNNLDLVDDYLKRLQSGDAAGISANTFESMVCDVLKVQFPTLERLGTRNSKEGDTDLRALCIGDIVVRIQVKYFDPAKGDAQPGVVEQLSKSMDQGDNGIVITSGYFSKEAEKYAEQISEKEGKTISLVNGQQFVELLFDNLDRFNGEQLRRWGVIKL